MKIAHLADIHLSELAGPIKDGENARMMDTVNCMNYAANKLIEEQPDIILIAGDLFHKSKLWADEMLKEITIASEWLRYLADIAPVVLMFGTANHDNIKAFENIRHMYIPNLTVVTEPDFLTINTKSGDIQIAAVPGMDKGYFRTLYPGMDMEDENKAISEALGNVVLGISADADPNIPCVLMAHYTVTGCSLENGETIFLNSDVVLQTSTLQASNYDLVCLGHIHRDQEVPNCGRPTFYSGPINGITFNEEGQGKGFWIHEVEEQLPWDRYHESIFIKTPSREFLTLNWHEEDVKRFINGSLMTTTGMELEAIQDKIVRVIYSCDDELNKQFNKKSLEKALYEAGAFYVSEIRPSKILTATDKQAMSENDSVEDNLALWLGKQELNIQDMREIMALADPIISEVAASLPTGKLSGIFEPVRLEVKNYRSYREEQFDFTKVSFATVNGPNGIGKSSFFMDALADCLFEEPREGELTGWISNGDDAKSGAITFEFLMGADKWRVIRTRAKSGKATLALQKWIVDKWEDHSGDKKDQTQEKIINLLGMDSMTFKSCALIMQDNYGLFLEADKTDRMQVLGNILGLGIFDKLHELAKDQLRVKNRNVENLKVEIAAIDEKLNSLDATEENLKNAQEERGLVSFQIELEEADIKKTEENVKRLTVLETKIAALTDKIASLTEANKTRLSEIEKQKADQESAQKIVDQEDKILAKIAEYEETKTKIAALKIKQPMLTQKTADLREIKGSIANTQDQINTKDRSTNTLKAELENKELLEAELSALDGIEKKLIILEKDKNTYESLSQKVNSSEQKFVLEKTKYNNDKDKIQNQIKICQKKSELINDSNCPLDKPSCNFLKDALEARNKIPELIEELEKLDYGQIIELKNSYNEALDAYNNFKYDSNEHEEYRQLAQSLRKKKEQLLSLSGKDELLKNNLQQLADLRKNLEELQDKKFKLDQEIQLLENDVRDLELLETLLPTLEHWNRGKDELPAAKQRLTTTRERIVALDNEIVMADDDRSSITAERDTLVEEKIELKGSEEWLQTSKNKIKSLQEELSNIDISIGGYKAKLEELQKYKADKEAKSERMNTLAKTSAQMAVLVQAFSIDGIPFQIVRSVVSELSAKSNEILSQMTSGKMSIEFKMDKVQKNKKEVNALEIWINDYQRGTMPYLSRSGGQKVKAALSVAFALADLKANRAGIQLGMMFIDEPPFLDSEGTQAYADALEVMHEQYSNMKVIAISHDPTMKARFPQSIDVMDSGDQGSKIIFNE